MASSGAPPRCKLNEVSAARANYYSIGGAKMSPGSARANKGAPKLVGFLFWLAQLIIIINLFWLAGAAGSWRQASTLLAARQSGVNNNNNSNEQAPSPNYGATEGQQQQQWRRQQQQGPPSLELVLAELIPALWGTPAPQASGEPGAGRDHESAHQEAQHLHQQRRPAGQGLANGAHADEADKDDSDEPLGAQASGQAAGPAELEFSLPATTTTTESYGAANEPAKAGSSGAPVGRQWARPLTLGAPYDDYAAHEQQQSISSLMRQHQHQAAPAGPPAPIRQLISAQSNGLFYPPGESPAAANSALPLEPAPASLAQPLLTSPGPSAGYYYQAQPAQQPQQAAGWPGQGALARPPPPLAYQRPVAPLRLQLVAPAGSAPASPAQQQQQPSGPAAGGGLAALLAFLANNKANLSNLIQLLPLVAQTVAILPKMFATGLNDNLGGPPPTGRPTSGQGGAAADGGQRQMDPKQQQQRHSGAGSVLALIQSGHQANSSGQPAPAANNGSHINATGGPIAPLASEPPAPAKRRPAVSGGGGTPSGHAQGPGAAAAALFGALMRQFIANHNGQFASAHQHQHQANHQYELSGIPAQLTGAQTYWLAGAGDQTAPAPANSQWIKALIGSLAGTSGGWAPAGAPLASVAARWPPALLESLVRALVAPGQGQEGRAGARTRARHARPAHLDDVSHHQDTSRARRTRRHQPHWPRQNPERAPKQ